MTLQFAEGKDGKVGYGTISPYQKAKMIFKGECHPTNQLLMLELRVKNLEGLVKGMLIEPVEIPKKIGRPKKDASL